MENSMQIEEHMEFNRVFKMIVGEKYKIAISACLVTGLIMGVISQFIYGGAARWSGVAASYCSGFWWAMLEIVPVTLGFVAVMFACAPFKCMRLLICPAVCFRAMGIGALICGVIQAEGLMGLCFCALVILPYTMINLLLTVYAGEFTLGMRSSLIQQSSNLRRGIMLHTFAVFALCLLVAALSCLLFSVSCIGFREYLL